MKPFKISRISEPENSAWRLYRTRNRIQTDPEYQRSSDIWTLEKKQLLIDTLLNGFDVPKLYFHRFKSPINAGANEYEYAIIDGKQRLEAIWEFIEGRYALSPDFECIEEPGWNAKGLTYAELTKEFPDLRNALDSYGLTIVCIETDDLEIIEDMFSRLNESVPLSAAEKRNAKGGPIPVAVKSLTNTDFFQYKLPFGNSRYRHYDIAVKFLMATEKGRVFDTKKRTLDRYVIEWAEKAERDCVLPFHADAQHILDKMSKVFVDKDKLLRQVGSVILYFHLFRFAHERGWIDAIQRHYLEKFDYLRIQNREHMTNGQEGSLELVDFDRYAQSSNDAHAVKYRLQILLKHAFQQEVPIEEL